MGIGQDARGEVVFVAGMLVDRAGGDAGEQLGFVVRADGGEDLAAVFARLVDEPGDLLELEGLLGGMASKIGFIVVPVLLTWTDRGGRRRRGSPCRA